MFILNESTVEMAALGWFSELGFDTLHGPSIAPGEQGQERESYEQAILSGRLQETSFPGELRVKDVERFVETT